MLVVFEDIDRPKGRTAQEKEKPAKGRENTWKTSKRTEIYQGEPPGNDRRTPGLQRGTEVTNEELQSTNKNFAKHERGTGALKGGAASG